MEKLTQPMQQQLMDIGTRCKLFGAYPWFEVKREQTLQALVRRKLVYITKYGDIILTTNGWVLYHETYQNIQDEFDNGTKS